MRVPKKEIVSVHARLFKHNIAQLKVIAANKGTRYLDELRLLVDRALSIEVVEPDRLKASARAREE